MSRADDLRSDYETLGRLLENAEPGAGAAAIVRERRILGEVLDKLETPEVVPFVDQVGNRRKAKAEAASAPARRRQPRRGA